MKYKYSLSVEKDHSRYRDHIKAAVYQNRMKLFGLVGLALVNGEKNEKKVPNRHPLERLERLVEFSHDLLEEWFSALPSKDSWKGKFEKNAARMKKNFERGDQRCGFYDENLLPHGGPAPIERKRREVEDEVDRYDREDPRKDSVSKIGPEDTCRGTL